MAQLLTDYMYRRGRYENGQNEKVREAINKKKSIYKDIGFIYFDPLPPPHNMEIKIRTFWHLA